MGNADSDKMNPAAEGDDAAPSAPLTPAGETSTFKIRLRTGQQLRRKKQPDASTSLEDTPEGGG